MEEIEFFNRHTGATETEKVYGEGFLRFVYEHPLGTLPLHGMIKRAGFSKWYGQRMDQPASREKIEPFIRDYELDPADFADPIGSFRSFNEFFYRKLKPEARPIDPAARAVFPADGRHLGFPRISDIDAFFVKGQRFDLRGLLGDDALARRFADGSLVLSRLCPVDYHRFHFPCAGTPGPAKMIDGPLYSVSPIALRRHLHYLWENKRTLTRLETPDLGLVLIAEIGATCVGSIHQTYTPGTPVEKGAEKGYFAFGGSSTITIFEPGAVTLADDLLENSARQRELYARIGTPMAR
ncbi:phosphatidylserine decarboxylase [Haloferula sargassicola]|uniref:Phosphatidylserine decarboxylase proenzyme n=1 Tax=Haloferula sargassicola TaxID=490096 RepID=A0ABP9URF8_9BACT